MRTPHKHADAIKAWADGELIQWRVDDNDEWQDVYRTSEIFSTPAFAVSWQYRIKPEPKPDVVKKYVLEAHHLAGTRFVEDFGGGEPCLKCAFDGETGKLKSAEVIA